MSSLEPPGQFIRSCCFNLRINSKTGAPTSVGVIPQPLHAGHGFNGDFHLPAGRSSSPDPLQSPKSSYSTFAIRFLLLSLQRLAQSTTNPKRSLSWKLDAVRPRLSLVRSGSRGALEAQSTSRGSRTTKASRRIPEVRCFRLARMNYPALVGENGGE